jgi:glyoxylase-like metal-dependent hydrolase (beta-lactamase superfamily II)
VYVVDRFGAVVRIRLAKALWGRPLQWVNVYWVDGLLIDTGCQVTLPDLITAIDGEGLVVTQLVNTHTHEDHTAGNAWVGRRFGVVPKVHPLGLDRLAVPETAQSMHWYRRFFWGVVSEGLVGAPLGDAVTTPHHRFRVIHTPGHADDHVALWDEEAGWLFSGDLLISPRLTHVRPEEAPNQLLASLRSVIGLPVRQLFCGHAGRVAESTQPLQAKVERWERLRADARELRAGGLRTAAIVRRLLGGPFSLLEVLSLGNLSRAHLIDGLLEGGD